MSLGDGNTDLRGLDVAAASADTNPGCAIGLASTEPLKEGGLQLGHRRPLWQLGVVYVGGKERAFVQWKVEW